MRIAIFTDSYKPQINGVVTSIETFVSELKRRGHDVYIYAPADPAAKEEKNVFRIRSFEFFGYKGYRIALPVELMVEFPIEKIKPDVIHIHSPFSIGMLGLRIAKKYKIPAVATFHTMYPDYIHYFVKPNLLLKVKILNDMFRDVSWSYIRWFHNLCDTVIAPTPTIKKVLKKNGIKVKTAVIPTGTHARHVSADRKRLRKKYGFNGEKIILHVGRVTREKNMETILRSLKPLLEGDYRFVITSDGPHKPVLEKLVKDEQIKNVTFTGFIPEKQLLDYYSLADVFVMGSATETQGIVLMDAAISSLPAVVLNEPVIADFVRENNTGLVATRKNFAEKVKFIAEKKPSFTKGFDRVRKNYDIRKCVDDLLELYQDQ